MSKPPAPVRVKLYGLFWLTRRGYYVLLGLEVLLLVVVLLIWAQMAPARMEEDAGPVLRFRAWFWNNVPWFVLAAVLLETIEIWFVLQKFAREEAARRARASLE
jgi:hypothetical protein